MVDAARVQTHSVTTGAHTTVPAVPFVPKPRALGVTVLFELRVPLANGSSSSQLTPVDMPNT